MGKIPAEIRWETENWNILKELVSPELSSGEAVYGMMMRLGFDFERILWSQFGEKAVFGIVQDSRWRVKGKKPRSDS